MATTAVSYFKRYKMEADLRDLPPPSLPPGFRWLPWSDEQLTAHAEVLYESFHQEIDAVVFPSLGNPDSCVTLMTVVSRRLNFLAEATWLAVGPAGPCGAIQGLHERGVRRDSERRRRSGVARPRHRRGAGLAGAARLSPGGPGARPPRSHRPERDRAAPLPPPRVPAHPDAVQGRSRNDE